jgi:hypothetical protein
MKSYVKFGVFLVLKELSNVKMVERGVWLEFLAVWTRGVGFVIRGVTRGRGEDI